MMTRKTHDSFRSSLFLLLSLLLSISFISCFPTFKNPIPPPTELRADHQILGTWIRTYKVNQSEYKEQLSIFSRSDGWIDVVWIYNIDKKDSTDGINLLVLEGYSSFVNKQRFLCLRVRERDFNWAGQRNQGLGDKKDGEQYFTKNWIIFNYEDPRNDELVIKTFSTQKVEELIEKGKLKGKVVKEKKEGIFSRMQGPHFDKIIVTSSSDELAKVIYKEGSEAFICNDPNNTFRFMDTLVFSKLGNGLVSHLQY